MWVHSTYLNSQVVTRGILRTVTKGARIAVRGQKHSPPSAALLFLVLVTDETTARPFSAVASRKKKKKLSAPFRRSRSPSAVAISETADEDHSPAMLPAARLEEDEDDVASSEREIEREAEIHSESNMPSSKR